jgi:hypothetical protein
MGIGVMMVVELDNGAGIAGDLDCRHEVTVASNQDGAMNLVLEG